MFIRCQNQTLGTLTWQRTYVSGNLWRGVNYAGLKNIFRLNVLGEVPNWTQSQIVCASFLFVGVWVQMSQHQCIPSISVWCAASRCSEWRQWRLVLGERCCEIVLRALPDIVFAEGTKANGGSDGGWRLQNGSTIECMYLHSLKVFHRLAGVFTCLRVSITKWYGHNKFLVLRGHSLSVVHLEELPLWVQSLASICVWAISSLVDIILPFRTTFFPQTQNILFTWMSHSYTRIIRSNRGSVNQEHIGDFGIPHAKPPLFNKSLIKINGAESLQAFLRRKGYFEKLSSALSRLKQKTNDLESNLVAEGVVNFCDRILSSTSRCKSYFCVSCDHFFWLVLFSFLCTLSPGCELLNFGWTMKMKERVWNKLKYVSHVVEWRTCGARLMNDSRAKPPHSLLQVHICSIVPLPVLFQPLFYTFHAGAPFNQILTNQIPLTISYEKSDKLKDVKDEIVCVTCEFLPCSLCHTHALVPLDVLTTFQIVHQLLCPAQPVSTSLFM